MSELNAQEKLKSIKKTGKILKMVTIITSIIIGVALVMFLLMPATNLYLAGATGKYGEGYNYYGWQLAIYGCGYPPVAILALFEESSTLAGDYIPTSHDFDTNIPLLLAVVAPIVIMIVCGIVSKNVKNKGKAVCEFITAAVLIAAGIIIANCASLSAFTAVSDGTTNFKDSFLDPALEAGTYKTLFYPVFICVFAAVIALFKGARGIFLLYQKAFAKKNKQKSTSTEAPAECGAAVQEIN